jgi:hypothetical protein
MSATRTWIPPMPRAWVAQWREAYLGRNGNPLLGAGGGVLSPTHSGLNADDERKLAFGPCWSWWRLAPEEKAQWWALDE